LVPSRHAPDIEQQRRWKRAESNPTADVVPSKIKGFKAFETRAGLRDAFSEKISRYRMGVEKLRHTWIDAADQSQKSSREMQHVVAKVQEMSKLFLEYIAHGEHDKNANIDFGEATNGGRAHLPVSTRLN
jgi:hypothetical protein